MRRRTWVLVGVGTAAVLAGTGVGVAAALYQPLEEGPYGLSVQGAPYERLDLSLGPDGPESFETITYRDGATVAYGFAVRNGGPWGVRITGVDLGPGPGMYVQLITPYQARLEPHNGPHAGRLGGTTDSETIPFQPFDLGPGEDRWVLIRARLGNCEGWSTGSTVRISDQGFQYSVLGIDHHASVRRRSSYIRISSPPASQCPRPRTVPDRPPATPFATPPPSPSPST
jgi:hypothetical protein